MSRIKILATGLGFIGGGIESIQVNLDELIGQAKNEIIISAYNIGLGGMEFIESLDEPLSKGVDVVFIINKFNDHHVEIKFAINTLMRQYLNLFVYGFTPDDNSDLHAKILIADRKRAIVGSSNLSWRGLVTNHELSVLIEGKEVSKLASAFDILIQRNMVERIDLPS